MTTHIDRLMTDVTVEPEPESASPDGDPRWDEAEQLTRQIERRDLLELRTRAEGFDD